MIPTVQRVSFPAIGPTKSKDLNNFSDQVVEDIVQLTEATNTNSNRIEEAIRTLNDEVRYLKRKVSQLDQSEEAKMKVNARNGLRVVHHQSMYNVDNLLYFGNQTLRPVVDSTYGIAHLPVNAIEPKFTVRSLFDNDIVTPLSFNATVSSVFIDEGSAAPTDHEAGYTKLIEGDVKNAFNGSNISYWIRSVEFPSSSDVTEVQCELVITIPSQNNTFSNVLTIHPYPVGGVDILDISFSADLTSSWTKLPTKNYPTLTNPLTNSREQKYIFPPQDVDQIRIRLRQRAFVIEDEKKIFRYGLQDLGLYLVDFEKATSSLSFSDWSAQADSESVACVYKIDAPQGHRFTSLNYFSTAPDFELEQDSNRHLIFRVYNGNPISGNGLQLWNSNQTLPQNQTSDISSQISFSGTVTSIYVSVAMRYVEASGGINSAFNANSSPWLKSFTLEYSLAPNS